MAFQNHQWTLTFRQGKTLAAQLTKSQYCARSLILLNFTLYSAKKKRVAVVVPFDACSAEDFRKLTAVLSAMQFSTDEAQEIPNKHT